MSGSSITISTPKLVPKSRVSAGMKRTRVNSLVDESLDSNRLVEMAAARQDYKAKALDVKRQKYCNEADKERYAAEDRAMVARERLMEIEHRRQQEKEEHERSMMQLQIQALQLRQQSLLSSHNPVSPRCPPYMDTSLNMGNPATSSLNNFGVFRNEGLTFPPNSEQSLYFQNKIFDGQF